MADSGMDFKTDAVSVAEPPPMDLEEGTESELDAPGESGESVASIQQEAQIPCGHLEAIPALPNTNSEICDPGTPETRSGSDIPEGSRWLSNPPDSSSLGYTEAGVKGSRDWMAQSAEPDPQKGLEADSSPQSPPAVDQGELLMELEDAYTREGAAEADQVPLEGLLAQLQRLSPGFDDRSPTSEDGLLHASDSEEGCDFGGDGDPLLEPAECRGPPGDCGPCPLHIATGHGLGASPHKLQLAAHRRRGRGLLSAETDSEDLLSLLHYEGGVPSEASGQMPLARSGAVAGSSCQSGQAPGRRVAREMPPSHGSDRAEGKGPCRWVPREGVGQEDPTSSDPGSGAHRWESSPEPCWRRPVPGSSHEEGASSVSDLANKAELSSLPSYKEVPGPCEPEDLLDGVIFGAKYLGSTQLISERNPPTHIRMAQAQKAVDRIKAPEGESQPMTEVDLFISTQRIKVLTADSQEAMMDHPLQTISYIADIGSIVVLMARRKLPRRTEVAAEKQLYKMICHVFHSADAPLIAQAIGQAFSVAYQHFLRASGIDPNQHDDDDEDLAKEEELYNGDLPHFSKQENCKEVIIHKQKGEILGMVIVESGWGSILPTVVVANLMHKGAAERSGKLSIGDRIMAVNGTSLVGLPLASCQAIIRDLKNQTEATLRVVHCPPVTTAIVRRPDAKYPLGFCVENGIICSLMRGGIAERGGIRVGHRIIEINGQSVVAMPHEKIIQILTQAVSEIHIKTMPASTYRLLTGQEQPIFL
ncbi:amyloid-beta A4 precursor protein-binding family A member 3 [Rhineura floridana]|uniref:amyloid-beta A4 precursor protein-binding family A member 3 n=1 Tax=Rhineura floridana TaxID=261503 RepID=UPI002AC7FE51|nr:amyloid-beta A4 precursor protein-binding family A member 3 [Rhineura floridana]